MIAIIAAFALGAVALVISCVAITKIKDYSHESNSMNEIEIRRLDDYERRLQDMEQKIKQIKEITPRDTFQGIDNTFIDFPGTDPWWCADMGDIYHVTRVEITIGKYDSEHAKNLRVGVTGDGPMAGQRVPLDDYILCEEIPGYMGEVRIINCPENSGGRYLVVQFNMFRTTWQLSIVNVKIYGYYLHHYHG